MNTRALSFAVVAWCCIGCAGLGTAVTHPTQPVAWKGYWLKQHQRKLTPPLEAAALAEGHGRTVLLVPGLTIGEEFFAPMKTRLERDGFRPVLYEDPELLATGLVPAAQRLKARVDELVAQTGEEKIDIVAECVGGVTARTYVAMFGGDQKIDHLVTFVSPHHGSMPASIASTVTGWQGMRDIERNSPLMQALEDHPVDPRVHFTSIYSCDDGYLWPASTAKVEGAQNVEICKGHVGHFDGFWDPGVYRSIVAGLDASAR